MLEEVESHNKRELSRFMRFGSFRFHNSSAVFVDPVRLLNLSYTHFTLTPSSYYSRFFQTTPSAQHPLIRVSQNQRKRKRKCTKPRPLNQTEEAADERHQRVKPFLIKAHECLLGAHQLLLILGKLNINDDPTTFYPKSRDDEHSFIELGNVWQAPLFEISLPGCPSIQICEKRNMRAFGSLVANETDSDMEADFLSLKYIIPKHSSFYMFVLQSSYVFLIHMWKSDLKQIHGLIPAEHEYGFKLIVIDPPWENGSANQKLKYPTLPNRYFLSLPIKRLAHADGALVALWVTNKEKLRVFVEKDLLPKWGVKYMATHYWLKVKADGSLISELDLFHHRPYECLVIGYCYGENEDSEYISKLKSIPDNQVFISIPGDYSRKPPIGEMLREYIGELEAARCLELFARELLGGWRSWGNEPLRFQDSRYFSIKEQ